MARTTQGTRSAAVATVQLSQRCHGAGGRPEIGREEKMSLNAHYSVAPRYTPGSPAMVDKQTALHVAKQEIDTYRVALEGVYGAEMESRSKTEGLDGIVLLMVDKGNRWEAHDAITGKVHVWPFEPKCPKCGKKNEARRGVLLEHSYSSRYGMHQCDGAGMYVGESYDHDAAAEHGLKPKFEPLV